KIPVELAEKLKRSYGYALSSDVSSDDEINLSDVAPSYDNDGNVSKRFLAEIIEARLEEIFNLVDNELKSLGPDIQLPAGVVISGGGVKIPGIEDLAKEKFDLPAKVGYPNTDPVSVVNPTNKELLEDPEFATALGLVFWGDEKLSVSTSGIRAVGEFFENLLP
ncbi:MAG: cell division FtsA domain-containing protein, partial [Candidatus Magasanikbacteria bacterium]